jgi:hypothetical protein
VLRPVVVVPAGTEAVGECGTLTGFDSVEGAVRALGHAVRYAEWLSTR